MCKSRRDWIQEQDWQVIMTLKIYFKTGKRKSHVEHFLAELGELIKIVKYWMKEWMKEWMNDEWSNEWGSEWWSEWRSD